ncbi:hypothetical protein SUGI_0131120 [Cryptomeria japonica]|nr:hypothetical protein SUGI_0131120 [Cryptomeria japonica]
MDERASDIEWARTLPPHYHKILSRAVIQKDCSSKEEFDDALCNSIQIEKGKQTIEGNWISSARFLDNIEKPVDSYGGFDMTPVKYEENRWIEFVVGELMTDALHSLLVCLIYSKLPVSISVSNLHLEFSQNLCSML